MNIQPNTYNNISMGKRPVKPNPNSFINRIKQKLLDAAPCATFDDSKEKVKKWVDFDNKMSKPAENRAVMGMTAIFLQPLIDSLNKRVDDETRSISICRTIAKIVVGTSVGIIVRGSAYNIVERMTNAKGNEKYSKSLLPAKYIEELARNSKFLKNYRSALSTGLAILAMCVTNFGIDAPFTIMGTNFLKSMFVKPKENKNAQEVIMGTNPEEGIKSKEAGYVQAA